MSIYPHKDKQGNLTGMYCVELTHNKQRRRGRFLTLQEAQETQLAWGHEALSATPPVVPVVPPAAPKTLGYLYDAAKDQLWRGKATEVQSLQRLEATVAHLGRSKTLATLGTLDIDNLVSELTTVRTGATVNRYLSALHSLLIWGQKRGMIRLVPSFTWQDEAEGRIRWITETEEEELLEALGPKSPTGLLTQVAIATGMRRNEMLHLEAKDVEKNWVRLWKTKTKSPRSVPINGENHDRLIHLITSGTMPTEASLRYQWDVAREAINLQDDPLFVFHATRHTCATRLVRANVNIRVIQQWLGHKRIETTLRYAHVNDTMLTDALNTQQLWNNTPSALRGSTTQVQSNQEIENTH